MIDLLSQAALDPGDEIVCGWPSFPSYVIDAAKIGAVARTVPLRDHVYDLDGLLAAIGAAHEARLRLPSEQPDRNGERPRRAAPLPRRGSRARARRARPGVLRVHRRPELRRRDRRGTSSAGRRVVVLRTFSKIYGLAGTPRRLRRRSGRRRRPRRARCGARSTSRPPRRRRRLRASATTPSSPRGGALNAEGRAALEAVLRAHGLDPVGPSVGNFLFADVGDGRAVFERLAASAA